MSVAAAALYFLSLCGERIFHPDYPDMIAVGAYMPLFPVQVLHTLGLPVLGLLMTAAVGVSLVVRATHSDKARKVLRVFAVLHLMYLSVANIGFALSFVRIARVLRQLD